MSIDAGRLAEAGARRETANPVRRAALPEPQDAVELSTRAQDIARFSAVAAASVERTELIDELKASIESGEYEIDHQAIAQALVDSDDELAAPLPPQR